MINPNGSRRPVCDAGRVTTILVVDNYDSFVFNLVQYLEQLGADCIVRRNDDVTTGEVDGLGVDGVLLSPGPGTPADAGVTALLAGDAADEPMALRAVTLKV